MTTIDQIKSLHSLFCELTGRPVVLDLQGYREHQWHDWLKFGFTPDDVRLTVKYLKAKVNKGERNEGCLKFNNLIGNPLGFEEDLHQARAESRKPKVDHSLNRVLKCTGRPTKQEEVKVTVRAAADVIAGEKAFEQFRALKESL